MIIRFQMHARRRRRATATTPAPPAPADVDVRRVRQHRNSQPATCLWCVHAVRHMCVFVLGASCKSSTCTGAGEFSALAGILVLVSD